MQPYTTMPLGQRQLPQGPSQTHLTKLPLSTQGIQSQTCRYFAALWNSMTSTWPELSMPLVEHCTPVPGKVEKPSYTALENPLLSLASLFLQASFCTFLPPVINTESKAQGFCWTELWVEGIKLRDPNPGYMKAKDAKVLKYFGRKLALNNQECKLCGQFNPWNNSAAFWVILHRVSLAIFFWYP